MDKIKLNRLTVLLIIGIVYIILIIILNATNLFSQITFVFLLSIAPLILINIYFLLDKDTSKNAKTLLPVFSSIFLIACFFLYVRFLPSAMTVPKIFGKEEFGILLYDNVEKSAKINKKNLRKELESIELDSTNTFKFIRTEIPKFEKKSYAEADLDELIGKQINIYDASVAIVFLHIFGDSISTKLHIASKLIEKGFPKPHLYLRSSLFQLVDMLKTNIKLLLSPTSIEADESNYPITLVEKAVISNYYFNKGTETLKKIFEISQHSSERLKVINQAETEIKKSIQLDPLNDKSLSILAYIHYNEKSDYDSAAFYYEEAKHVQPKIYTYSWNLAQSYYRAGKKEEAIRTIQNYLSEYGDDIEDASQKLEMEKLLKMYQEEPQQQ